MARETHEAWGRTTKDQITQTPISQWAASLVPEGHVHVWSISSLHQQTKWFGIAPIACGGPSEGAFAAYHLAHVGEQAAAEQAYRDFQDILTGTSSKSMAVHNKAVVDAAVAAADRKRQKELAARSEK